MKIALLVLLILGAGYGVYFSVQQQGRFEETIKERVELIEENDARTVVKRREDSAAQKKEEELDACKIEVQKQLAALDGAKRAGDELSSVKEQLESEYEALNAEMEPYNVKLAAYGVSDPQEIETRHSSAKEENEKLKAEKEETDILVAAQSKKVAGQEKDLSALRKQQDEYRSMVSKNAREYKVLTVDPQWGFVVVSAGEDSAIEPTSVLLVMRSGQNVAKLKVTSLEKRQTIADIIPSSVAKGNAVQPGDTVILLNPKG